MIRRGNFLPGRFVLIVGCLFLFSSCTHIPLIGKKKEKPGKLPEGKTVTIEGMENIKGINPPKQDVPLPSQKPSVHPPIERKEPETKLASIPTRPLYSPPILPPQVGFKKKIAILDFANKTAHQEEKIGEVVAERLTDKLEATQRVLIVDTAAISEILSKQGVRYETLTDPSVMKLAHRFLGIQAFALGTVTDVNVLPGKPLETSDEESAFATAKVEIRLIDASTGNVLRSFVGRSPIFGTKEIGEHSRSKAALKAIDFGLDDILEGFLRQLDLLEWTTTIATIDGENIYINAGKVSGLRVGDTFEIFEPGKEIIHSATKFSLGWTTGRLKGVMKITELFGVDAAMGKVIQGDRLTPDDVVKAVAR